MPLKTVMTRSTYLDVNGVYETYYAKKKKKCMNAQEVYRNFLYKQRPSEL